MTSLPVLDCTDCGVCCLTMGNPPFMGFEIYELPEPLRSDMLNVDQEREDQKLPCIWLVDKKCSNYKHRPILCRDFEVGSDACISMRECHGR